MPGHENLLPFMGSWLRHVEGSAWTTYHLSMSGMHTHAAPVRRSCVEHAFALDTLANDPETYGGYLNEVSYRLQSIQGLLNAAGVDEEIEGLTAYDDFEFSDEVRKKFTKAAAGNQSRAFPLLRAHWSRDSQLSHPSAMTWSVFLKPPGDDGVPTLSYEPQAGISPDVSIRVCVEAFVISLEAYSSVLADPDFSSTITELRRTIGPFEALGGTSFTS